VAIAVPLLPGTSVAGAVLETWESESNGPFDGVTANNVWLGDATSFFIDSATWPPTPPSPDFGGSHSLRSPGGGVAMDLTTVTSISGAFDATQTMRWSVFVSGLSQNITSTPRDFSLILMSDSSTAANIESGSVNGYRLRLGDNPALGASSDSLLFEKANGSGWSILMNIALAGTDRNINEGWNLLVERTPAGVFTFGFANGAIGTPVSLLFSTTDTSVTSASFAGMNYRTPATGDNAFGFDNFQVAAVPEPATLALLALAGLGFARRRKLH
jgi:hypothetical protein